jgi:hypothetical protein
MRATDAGLHEPVTVLEETPIDADDTDLELAQQFCKIRTR